MWRGSIHGIYFCNLGIIFLIYVYNFSKLKICGAVLYVN
jgi:hypothetical protein